MDESDETSPSMNSDIETEVKELMGLFDLPAFARRGQDLEATLRRMHLRCRAARGQLLEMVHLRLRQWSSAAAGNESWRGVFTSTIEPLWVLAEASPPRWAAFGRSTQAPTSHRARPGCGGRAIQSPLAPVHRSNKPRAGQLRDRSIQSLLRPRKGMRHGLGAAGRPPFHSRGTAHQGNTARGTSNPPRPRAGWTSPPRAARLSRCT